MKQLLLMTTAGIALALGASAYAQIETYSGQQLEDIEGSANFDAFSDWGAQSYDEGGMNFAFIYGGATNGFAGYAFHGGNGTYGLYVNGGGYDIVSITRLDGQDFNTIEMQVGDGWGGGHEANYIWAICYLDGVPVAEFDIDQAPGGFIGFTGSGFDEIRIGAYYDGATRDQHNEENYNAIALDDVAFGNMGGGFAIEPEGSCPGSMTIHAYGGTPDGRIGFAYSLSAGPWVIPGGPCAGTELGIVNPTVVGIEPADGDGHAMVTGNVPPAACGRVYVQAVDVPTCTPSNVLGL